MVKPFTFFDPNLFPLRSSPTPLPLPPSPSSPPLHSCPLVSPSRPQILELTLLMASYINHWTPSLPSSATQQQGSSSSAGPCGDNKLWDVDSRHFPSMNYTTKGPTLL